MFGPIERRRIEQDAILHYGREHQLHKAIEELAELTQAISKYQEYDGQIVPEEIHAHILEEMADVQIMLEQLELIFGSSEPWTQSKLHRLSERLEA